MKADRLLSALLLLQAHGRMTGRQLAKRLEVSLRTVHRDMEALGAAGVPVFALRGAQGGWQLDEGWRTRVPGLDAAELRALLMAQPRALGDGRLARAAERALAKLMASLPTPLRLEAASLRQRLHVDATGWWGGAENLKALPIVQEAVSHDRKLSIRYAAPGRERVERTVDPLGLVAKGATWYLVARTPDGLRTYRVSRIEDAKVLDARCERPAGFDLAGYWQASTEELRRTRNRYAATLRLDPSAAKTLGSWRSSEPAGADEPDAAGRILRRVLFDDEEQALFVTLGLGAGVEVVEPAALRERVFAEVAAMARPGGAQFRNGSTPSFRT
ncbi:MAG TPA: transcriptional regulator [Vicinamibacteria bacterium]|nr:transcriptional regulator [Vicinamibacteria bacterium]